MAQNILHPQAVIPYYLEYLEESNILLQKVERYSCDYDMCRKKIMSYCADNGIDCPNIHELCIPQMMLLIIPRDRWNTLVEMLFRGMVPPVFKHPVYNTYMVQMIPMDQMTVQQKNRAYELRGHISGAIWTMLTRVEKMRVCEGIRGMKINMNNLLLSYRYSVQKDANNKDVIVENDGKKKRVIDDNEEDTVCSKNNKRTRDK